MKRDCVCPRTRHEHGTLGAYQCDRCRCFACRLNRSRVHLVYAEGGQWLEAQWHPAVGVARRLQALTAIGYTDRMLADELGKAKSYIIRLRTVRGERVVPDTYDRVCALYDRWWDKPYTGPYSVRTVRLAAAKGWAPPLAWDDEEIDDPAASPRTCSTPVIDEVAMERRINGDHQPLTIPELAEAVLILHGKGWSETAIARRLRMSGTRVGQIIDRDEAA